MKLTPIKCPTCGADPKTIVETVFLETGLQSTDAKGETEFDSARGSDVLWDSTKPVLVDGRVMVRCAAYHQWLATLN